MIQTFTSLEAIERHYSSFPFHQVTSAEAQDSFYKKQNREKKDAIERLNKLGSDRCKIIADLESISGMASALTRKIVLKPDCIDTSNEIQISLAKKELSRLKNTLEYFEDNFLFGDLSGSF